MNSRIRVKVAFRISDFTHKYDCLYVFQAIGLVENQSDWYLGKLWKNHQPWPALVCPLFVL